MNPLVLCCVRSGHDHNCTNSSTVASEKWVGHPPGNSDAHTNTAGGTVSWDIVRDSVARSRTALLSSDRFASDKSTVTGEAGSGGEACSAFNSE